jgi:hypothetical protein
MSDELQRRINEHVLNGDAPSIIWAMEGQIRINTKLEAENTALREFVVGTDDLIEHCMWTEDGNEPYMRLQVLRQRLADEFNLAIPEATT